MLQDGTYSVLVVDDDSLFRSMATRILEPEGYAVRCVQSGEEALAVFPEMAPDLVLLDMMMPKMDGFAVCERLRRMDNAVPILFVTSGDETGDEVRALETGADDFIAKGDVLRGLLARIKRAIERTKVLKGASVAAETAEIDGVRVDFSCRTAELPGGEKVKLTGAETDILRLFVRNRGSVMGFHQIAAAIHGGPAAVEEGTIRSQISRLKTKLGLAATAISSVRGSGYILSSTS